MKKHVPVRKGADACGLSAKIRENADLFSGKEK
jgi:hypothetical protein